MLACLLVACAIAQGEPPIAAPAKPAAATTEAAAIVVPAFTDQQATQALAEWKKLPAKAALADRVAALDALVRGKHATLVPVLEKVVRTDASAVIRKKAAEALGWQPEKQAYDAVSKLLEDPAVEKTVEVIEPLVNALGRVGYKAKNWSRLETLFGAAYAAERTGLQRAIVVLAGQQKEKQAIALLLENFDEPVPGDVHGAANPPAEYWEARWKAWKTWRDDVKTAVQRITGQKFASAAEAKAWLRTNGQKMGFKG